ncbi:hypothetical protein PC116_g28206 [Phytophthora cactorum]|uniref:Uncharacterized protein n=1 Tax=Phytophthora cactorum TaxID=29920 RepID=A0A8T1AQ66_9STRA|nr:hypothetical protein PC114_g25573 [Phytophthora cactorum]KAG2886539.1 hypothetical protein PC117_g25358 [Phytophthora cactorum]KAG2961329.1 hypothetical protein PC119_g26137 [Phytophthora cactorum]KAG2973420.1 hypothetical protein PC120_g26147 [Phytophthora cactorum]KAG3123898.1 hypothetical protein C6341_g26374 [Phytophthora cactorum]
MTTASTMRSSRWRADTKTANRVSRMGHATAISEVKGERSPQTGGFRRWMDVRLGTAGDGLAPNPTK